jgi:ankyrin repeat protein
MAVRPLTLSELSVAVDVKPSVGLTCDDVIRNQVSYCGHFLTIKEDEVGLIHQSAKDYLLRKSRDPNPELEFFRVKENIGNLEIARKCFYYLQSGAFADDRVNLEERYRRPKDTLRLKNFPLLSYATMHWPKHARSLDRSEDIFGLSLPFYAKKSPVRESWLETYWATEYPIQPNSFTLLHLASFFGILPLAENLVLKKGLIDRVKLLFTLNKTDSSGTTALSWAARNGHEAVVRLLLEKGADVEAKAKYGETALSWAAANGHEAVVRLLLEKGADVEAKAKYKGTALSWAAENGHEAVVRLLLEKGADVEAKAEDGETALWAAAGGLEAVVELLLQAGAKLKSKDKEGRAPL